MATSRIGKNGNDIHNASYPDAVWIVPGLIPAGMTLLAGRPKAGKSWISLQVSKAVTSGGEIFGEKVECGKVLYLALEDNDRRLKKRMEMQGWSEKSRKNIDFITFNSFVDKIGFLHIKDNAKKLYKEVESGKYRMLVIDTFSNAFLGLKNIDDNQMITLVLKPLQEISLEKNISTLMNDHHNKMSEQNPNLINDVMGSTAKVSISDTIMGVYRKGRGVLQLLATGKDIDDIDMTIKRDEHFVWTKDTGVIPGLTAKDIQLLSMLPYKESDAMSLSTLSLMTLEGEGNLSNRLSKLRRLGHADKTKDGFIRLNGHLR